MRLFGTFALRFPVTFPRSIERRLLLLWLGSCHGLLRILRRLLLSARLSITRRLPTRGICRSLLSRLLHLLLPELGVRSCLLLLYRRLSPYSLCLRYRLSALNLA